MRLRRNHSKVNTQEIFGVCISEITKNELKRFKIIKELPEAHKKSVDWIRIMDEAEWIRHWETKINWPTPYIHPKMHIAYIARSNCEGKLILHVLKAIGYMFYIYDLPEVDQYEYNKVEREYLTPADGYGKFSEEDENKAYNPESFAECYAYYVLDSAYLLKLTPNIYHWFKRRIFGGKTFIPTIDLSNPTNRFIHVYYDRYKINDQGSGKITCQANVGVEDYVNLIKNKQSYQNPDTNAIADFWFEQMLKADVAFKRITGRNFRDALYEQFWSAFEVALETQSKTGGSGLIIAPPQNCPRTEAFLQSEELSDKILNIWSVTIDAVIATLVYDGFKVIARSTAQAWQTVRDMRFEISETNGSKTK